MIRFFCLSLLLAETHAFLQIQHMKKNSIFDCNRRHSNRKSKVQKNFPVVTKQTQLRMSSNGNRFDLSRKVFDLFSLRTIRNDALLQYNALNQSEPLRINLSIMLSIALFSYPTLSEAVVGETAQLPATIISILGGIGSAAVGVKECSNRLKQLTRIEKEMNAEFLTLKLSTKNKFDDKIYGKNVIGLKTLRGKKRVLAISGKTEDLKDAVEELRIFRRRFDQADAIVAVVPTDGKNVEFVDFNDLGVTEADVRSSQWLGEVQDVNSWLQYFKDLASDSEEEKEQIIWFGLNNNGRSFASGSGEPPRILELLGQNLRPVSLLDESDEDAFIPLIDSEEGKLATGVLDAQKQFYNALTGGDLASMNKVFTEAEVDEVSEVISAGGRADGWESCLAEGARPSGMIISGCDVLIASPTRAYR